MRSSFTSAMVACTRALTANAAKAMPRTVGLETAAAARHAGFVGRAFSVASLRPQRVAHSVGAQAGSMQARSMSDAPASLDMKVKIYVGNLNWKTTNTDLQQMFSQYGQVQDAIVIQDRETGRSRGFGFVTFDTESAAEKAAKSADQTEFQGRVLKVNIAENKPREDRRFSRPNREGGFRSGGGGGGGAPGGY